MFLSTAIYESSWKAAIPDWCLDTASQNEVSPDQVDGVTWEPSRRVDGRGGRWFTASQDSGVCQW